MSQRQLSISKAVARQLRDLNKEAVKRGQANEFRDAVRRIVRALKAQPLPPAPNAFGCPQYHLAHMRLLACVAVVPPVSVRFAVAEVGQEGNGADPQIVYVSRFDLLS